MTGTKSVRADPRLEQAGLGELEACTDRVLAARHVAARSDLALAVVAHSGDDFAARYQEYYCYLQDVSLSQHRMRLARYDSELGQFEQQHGMASAEFYRRFEAGEAGDAMHFFEWAGLYELREDILKKIERLEMAA